ncbi:UPF0738 family protein [Bacillus massilinigeriensis]|uniref:UPF0738 family protein n=1 Tax=Bacillus mediterraneensis TaxID=1805474 RepID=UPI0008F8817D|nr:hypothetical protein [Bacillus mediterraneensis]
MTEKIHIEQGKIENGKLVFTVGHAVNLQNCTGTGKMLVDSDNLAFIYIAEQGEAYTYFAIPEKVWPELKSALDDKFEVVASDGKDTLLFTGIKEEMEYLTENIKGNSNYGEDMVAAVERIF